MKSKWKELPLGEIVSLIIDYRGKTPKKLGGAWSTKGIRALSAKNIKTREIVQPDTIRYVDPDMYNLWMKDEIQRGDILITSEAPFGEVFYWDSDEKIVLSQRLFAIRCKKEYYAPFVFHYMTSKQFQGELRGRATGTTVTGLRQPELLKCLVKLPENHQEQRTIADALSAIDSRIALNKKINHHLEQMVQAIYKSWFVDFEPWDGVMPEDWRLVKLERLCQSISKTHAFDKDKLIFLNTGDIDKGQFLHSNYSQVNAMPGQAKKSICCGDILYSEIRPINKHYAYVNFDAPDYVVSTKLMVIRTDGIDSRRLYHYLTYPDVVTELQIEAESRSGTFPQIRFENIQQLEIVLASSEVERNFTALLHNVYAKIDANVAESKRLAELRGTLLPRLMSGELSVADI